MATRFQGWQSHALRAGSALTVTTGPGSAATIARVGQAQPQQLAVLGASGTATVGPFTTDYQIVVDCLAGYLDTSVAVVSGGGTVSSLSYVAGTKTVSGTAPANAVVTVKLDGTTAGTATADGTGAWSYTFGSAPTSGQVISVSDFKTSVTGVSLTVQGFVRGLQIVASRGIMPYKKQGNGSGVALATRVQGRSTIRVGPYDVTRVTIATTNAVAVGNGADEALIPNDVVVENAIEEVGTTAYTAVTYGGQNTGVMPAGSTLFLSDVVAGKTLTAKAQYRTRMALTVSASTLLLACGQQGTATGDGSSWYSPAAIVDATQVRGTGQFTNPGGGSAASAAVAPRAILGYPASPHPALIILFDSIGADIGGTPDAEGNVNWVAQSCTNITWNGISGVTIPYDKDAIGGDTAAKNGTAATAKMGLWPYASHLIGGPATNDIIAGATFAQVTGYITAIATKAKGVISNVTGRPLHVTYCLVWPREGATDGVPATGFGIGGVAEQVNAWLLAQVGLGLIDAVIDPAAGQRDSTNPNIWNPTYRPTDRTHPNQTSIDKCVTEVGKPYMSSLTL